MSRAKTSDLGAHVVEDGCRFGLWAPRATRVQVTLVDALNEQHNVDMELGKDGIWSVKVPGIGFEWSYGFRVHGPWDPASGSRFNPKRLLLDPYGRAISGGLDFRGPILDHKQGDPSAPSDVDSFGAVPLSVVVADTPPPTPVARRRPMSETVIYETHLRGYTKLHPLVPDHLRGSYLGMADPAVIEYLTRLGITAVEFLPLQHFLSEPHVAFKGLRNYWGYNTLGFFAPHAQYATRGTVGYQVSEFKTMVSKLHEAGIEVILDVVYNHTAEGGHEGPTLSWRGIDHEAYYRLTNDRSDGYDVTGCGNSVDTSNPMVLQMVLDSMRYWVEHMGVDGFRFDLATTLIRDENHQVDQNHRFKELVAQDPAFEGIKMIVAPWDQGPDGDQSGRWGEGWAEWNSSFRDSIRDFWRGASHGVGELATRLAGSSDVYGPAGAGGSTPINFVTAHDGFTMHDLVSYDVKHNLANGEQNLDGTDDNRSWNHGWEGETSDEALGWLRRRQVLNLMATQILAAGTPMITAGDEFGRTQKGNNNAYCQDSPLSWVNWDVTEEWEQVQLWIGDLLRLRADFPILRTRHLTRDEVLTADGQGTGRACLAWLDGSGGEMTDLAWYDHERHHLAMYRSDEDSAFILWVNGANTPIQVQTPSESWGRSFEVVATTADSEELPDSPLEGVQWFFLPARSIILMQCDVSPQ